MSEDKDQAWQARAVRAEADYAALRVAVEGLMPYAPGGTPNDLPPMVYAAVAALDRALVAPHPGEAMLTELALLRGLRDAIEAIPDAAYEPGCDCDYCTAIDAARLALRGGTPTREGL